MGLENELGKRNGILREILKRINAVTSTALAVDITTIGGDTLPTDGSTNITTSLLPVGGQYNATPPTYTDGDATVLQTNINGELIVDSGASGAAVAADADCIYSNAQGDFTAAIVDSSKNVTISGFTGLSLANIINGNCTVIRTGTGAVESVPNTTVSLSGSIITYSDLSTNFATGDIVVVTLIGSPRTKDISANVVMTTNEAEDRYHRNVGDNHIYDGTGTAGASSVNRETIIPWDTYSAGSLELRASCLAAVTGGATGGTITITLWATNNAAVTQPATADTEWVDVTSDLAGVASYVLTAVAATDVSEKWFVFLDTRLKFEYLMIKFDYQVTGATTPLTGDVYYKKGI